MKRSAEWVEYRCTICNGVLCWVVPAPGMKIENECRKCGTKDIRAIEGPPIDFMERIRVHLSSGVDKKTQQSDIVTPNG